MLGDEAITHQVYRRSTEFRVWKEAKGWQRERELCCCKG